MLTVKHIEGDGSEGLRAAQTVRFFPGGNNEETRVEAYGCEPDGGAVGDDGCCRYADGRVYVMNAAGATVGSYDLT